MSRYWNQNRSNFRTGESPSHSRAAQNVCDIVDNVAFFFTTQREVISFPDGYQHEFDIIIRKFNYGITHFVEIGWFDDSKHGFKSAFAPNKSQQENDGIVEGHAKEWYPKVMFVRINKDDTKYPAFILGKKCLFIHKFID